jgi:hypothetical protein
VWFKRLWNWLRTPSRTPSEPPEQQLETAAIETMQDLAARVVALEAQITQLQLSWQETLDKLGRWASKQAARERRRVDRDLDHLAGEGSENGSDSLEDAPESTNGGGPDPQVGGAADRAVRKAQLRARAAQLRIGR